MKINIIKKAKENKLLTLAFILTAPSVVLWIFATISFIYINYVGPFIFGLSEISELTFYYATPISGFVLGIIVYKKTKSKPSYYIVVTNLILVSFVLFASAFLG